MATGDGVITRKDIITDEALAFGKEYRKNVEEAINANDELIKQFRILHKVSGDYRKSQDQSDFRKAKQEESIANQKMLNELKQMGALERELERIKQEKVKTEKELLRVAKENLKVATQKAQMEGAAERELQKIKQDRARTEKELVRVQLENEKLSRLQAQTEQTNAKEVQRLKQELLRTEREAAKLKQDKIRLERMESDQVKRKTVLTMEERVQQQLLNKADKDAVLEKMGLIGAYQKLNRQRTEAKKRLQDLIAAEGASNREIRKAQQEFDRLDAKVRKADNATRDFTKNVGNYKSAFSGLSNLMGAFGIIGGVAGAVELGKSIYKTTKEIQAQEIALRMLSETEVVYAKNKDFLIRISEQYGLELMTTTNAYKNYFAAAKTSIEEGKLSFEQMQMIFEKVSKSASMLGLSVEQQEGAFLALSQMLSKGTVQSEELRGQLGERLPGAFEVMAKALNVTTMELGDMLKKGEVMATDVLPKFAIAYEKAIGADQIERTESLAAAQNRASNKWTEFVDNLNSGQGLIAATGMMFFDWTSQVLDLVSAKDKLSDKLFDEQLELNTLISKITSLNEDNSERLKLIEDLKSNYPGFISFIKNEDYSNQNLRKTLSLVNAQYRERITLQLQVENLEKAQQDRDKAFRTEALLRLELQRKLNKINVKYNLGFENITDSTAPQIADQIQSAARKQLGALEQLEIEKLQSGIEAFSKTVGEKNKIVEEEITLTKKVQEQTGQQTEAQRKQNQQQKEYNSELFRTITLAEKLGGKKTIDFDPFDIDSVKNFISSKQNASAGESDKDRNKREAAERKAIREREKAIKEAEKLENDRLKKEKESYEAGIDLLIYKKNAEAEIFKAESVNEKNTQDERYKALISSQKAEEDALKLSVEKQLTLSRAFQKDKKAFSEQEIYDMLSNKSIRKDITDEELLILEKYYAEQEKLRKQNKKDIESNIDFEILQLKKKQDSKLLGYQSEMSGDIGALSVGNNLIDVENYEKAVYEIKRKYMLKEIEDNIALYKSILENENLTQEQKEKNTKILLGLQEDLREFNNQTHIDNLTKANEIEQRYIEMGENIKNALVDLTNAIFDNRIQRIDEDIERSDEQYERQIELYEGDAARQKAIREQQEREREKLEAKKRKEQHKQAVFNKAMAVADIGWKTAQAIMGVWVNPGYPMAIPLTIAAGLLGTIQTAAVLATPIPKYKMGRKDGPEEIAIVGDGGVHEVVEHPDGSAYITPNRDTVVKLFEGDVVHSSIDKYRESQRVASLNGLQRSQNIMGAYLKEKEYRSDEGLIKEIRELQRILKNKNMTTTVNVPKMDLGHELWRLKQIGGLK